MHTTYPLEYLLAVGGSSNVKAEFFDNDKSTWTEIEPYPFSVTVSTYTGRPRKIVETVEGNFLVRFQSVFIYEKFYIIGGQGQIDFRSECQISVKSYYN